MKDYKRFIITFAVLLTIYIIAEINRPKPLNWELTLSLQDKNPYGAYCLFNELKDIFPDASIQSYRSPVYNQVNNFSRSNTGYLLISPNLVQMSKEDVNELLRYTAAGNYVFLCSSDFSKPLQDTLKFKTARRFDFTSKDSITINFKNPLLHTRNNTGFRRMTLDGYFSKMDTLKTTILGNNQLNDANFIQLRYGKGVFFIHVLPLCFSNYFMLTGNNASYAAKALSHIPPGVTRVFWDEYYKPGQAVSGNPLRYILKDPYLRWAFRLGLVAMVLFVLFGIKRRQRIIPVIPALQNSTMDFVQTIGNVCFNKQDNKNIAEKMIGYFLEYVRAHFFLPTQTLDEQFVQTLSGKTGVPQQDVEALMRLIETVHKSTATSDLLLLQLNRQLDAFYRQAG